MAALNLYLANAVSNGWRRLSESTQVAATINDGWIVGTGSTNHSAYFTGVERAANTFSDTVPPDGSLDATNFDAFRSELAYTGDFASANWDVHFVVVSVSSTTGQDGRIRFRLFMADADGGNAVEITSGHQQASVITDVAATDEDSTLTFNPGAFSIANQYLFLQLAWERTGAASMTTADVNWRTGSSSSAGTRLTTADFAPSVTIPIPVGAIDVTGQAPAMATTLLMAVGSLVLAGQYVGVAFIGPETGQITLAGQAPTVVEAGGTETTIPVPAGSVTLSGQVGSLAYVIDLPAGTVTIAGQAPAASIALPIPAGTLDLAGQTPLLAQVMALPDGALTLTGLEPSANVAGGLVTIPVDVGALTLTGTTSALQLGLEVPAGSLTLSGLAALIQQTLALPAGSLALLGQAPSLAEVVTLPSGAIVLAGEAPSVQTSSGLLMPVGAITLTGQTPALVFVYAVPAGAVVLTGQAPIVTASLPLPIPAGTLVLTGEAPSLAQAQLFDLPVGTLVIAGQTPTFALVLPLQTGTLTFTGYVLGISGGEVVSQAARTSTSAGALRTTDPGERRTTS